MMVNHTHVSDSEESEVDLIDAPSTPSKNDDGRESYQPVSILSHRFREFPNKPAQLRDSVTSDTSIAVVVEGPARRWEYESWNGDTTVDTILEEFNDDDGGIWYRIEFESGKKQDVSFDRTFRLRVFLSS
jgi:hypothetical protein